MYGDALIRDSAFDFAWDSGKHVRKSAKVIHRIDYRRPAFLMRRPPRHRFVG
jgi:hypothetical protein